MPLDYDLLINSAKKEKENFRALTSNILYESKGILFSEMFFLFLCSKQSRCKRILESGRARGQSTLILAKTFPEKLIISFEYDPNSIDVQIAEKRLQSYSNIDLRFGDAVKLLPEVAENYDITLIDGPKGFRGLRFGLQLMATGKIPMIFIHDTNINTPERKFLERYLPNTLYSDTPDFSSITHDLDDGTAEIPSEYKFHATYPNAGYGYSLACLVHDPTINYRSLYLYAIFFEMTQRLNKSITKRFLRLCGRLDSDR